jgi:hypothetical protein
MLWTEWSADTLAPTGLPYFTTLGQPQGIAPTAFFKLFIIHSSFLPYFNTFKLFNF